MIIFVIGLVVILLGGGLILAMALDVNPFSKRMASGSVRNLMSSRVSAPTGGGKSREQIAREVAEATGEKAVSRSQDSRTRKLERWLKYADLPISAGQFRAVVAGSIAFVYILALFVPRINPIVHVIVALWGGYLLPHWFANRRLRQRFNVFDRDFAPFMLSLVGLLKTGMNIMTAIEVAGERLGPDSMFRLEIVRMLERLRFGVSEDQAIGAFAEGIDHPDIELFVQAMLLSKRVGGSLTDTLERLARQSRRRAQFRMQAQSAVGQQRGSVWFIVGFIGALQGVIYYQAPDLVLYGLKSDAGWVVWQGAFLLCWFAVWLVGYITRLRV